MKNLDELLKLGLKDAFSAESQIIRTLPKLIKKSSTPQLKKAFEKHLHETEEQIERLKQVSEILDATLRGHHCKGMEGIIDEGEEFLKEEEPEAEVCDAGIIGAAQKVEHYEIALYGTIIAYAKELGCEDKVISLLVQTLEEEKAADLKLTELAEGGINRKAE